MKNYLYILSLLLMIFGVIAGIFAAICYKKYKKMLSLLNEISNVAKLVEEGDLSKKIEYQKESQKIGTNINNMIDSIQERENKIKEFQKEVHGQKEYLEAILNSMVDGMVIISQDCLITKINPPLSLWLGLKEEEIIGRKLNELIHCKCSIDCNKHQQDIAEVCPLICLNERLAPTEASITNLSTNSEKIFELSSAPISGKIGYQSYVIGLKDITDVTEVNKIREDFIAALTHDLRVPILAEANTLKLFLKNTFGQLNEKQIFAIETMLESNNGMLMLVNSLLDSYKYDSGEIELFKEQTNIRKIVQDCIAELSSLAQKHNQTLSNVMPKDLPILYIDKNEIKRVFRNLINNSIAYTPKEGTITIDAENHEKYVLIKVKDNGKGIPEAELDTIFDRFFSKAKKFRKVGTGLGLYLSKKIIEKHNGKIWAESTFGKGSTFKFTIPVENKK